MEGGGGEREEERERKRERGDSLRKSFDDDRTRKWNAYSN